MSEETELVEEAGADDREAYLDDLMRREAIIYDGAKYRVLTRTGYYDTLGVNLTNLIPRIRELGMQGLVPIEYVSVKGELRPLGEKEILRGHLTQADEVHGVTGDALSAKAPPKGCWFKDTADGRRILLYSMYGLRDDLEPTFDPGVDTWLGHLVGAANKARLLEWIAHSLDLGKPTCSLSLAGPPSCGKNMLVAALGECITSGIVADGSELTGKYRYQLLRTPFLFVDEGLADGGGKHAADTFRRMAAGGPIPIERKYEAPILIDAPVRVIFAANNDEMVRQVIAGARNLSSDDAKALAMRILHLPVKQAAAAWLAQKGGYKLTARHGQRWIKGPGGEASDYIVAKHFLWLHANRKAQSGQRLLVEGDVNSALAFDMRTQSGDAPVVLEAIVGLVNDPKKRDGFLMTYDAKTAKPVVWALPSAVLQYMRIANPVGASRTNTKQIGSVFRGLSSVTHKSYPTVLADRKHLGAQRWFELDPGTVHQAAQKEGWASPRLDQFIIGQLRCGVANPTSGEPCHLIAKHPSRHVAKTARGRVSWGPA